VVSDDTTGPTDGQDVRMRVALRQKTSRDDIYKSMQFLYRYAMTRRPFEPIAFTGQVLHHRRRSPIGRQSGGENLA